MFEDTKSKVTMLKATFTMFEDTKSKATILEATMLD